MFCTLFSICLDLLQGPLPCILHHLMMLVDPWTLWLWLPSYCKALANYQMALGPSYQTLLVGLIACSHLWSSIICEDHRGYYVGQFALWSFDNVFIKFSKVCLNFSQIKLPHGLYGVVVICWTPHILHKWCITSFLKLWPLSLWIRVGMRYMWNYLSISALATVSAFWFGVTTATANLENASVITRTFSLPPGWCPGKQNLKGYWPPKNHGWDLAQHICTLS